MAEFQEKKLNSYLRSLCQIQVSDKERHPTWDKDMYIDVLEHFEAPDKPVFSGLVEMASIPLRDDFEETLNGAGAL